MIGQVFTHGKGEFQMITVEFITNMVIGVATVVIALMIVLIFQIYKNDEKK